MCLIRYISHTSLEKHAHTNTHKQASSWVIWKIGPKYDQKRREIFLLENRKSTIQCRVRKVRLPKFNTIKIRFVFDGPPLTTFFFSFPSWENKIYNSISVKGATKVTRHVVVRPLWSGSKLGVITVVQHNCPSSILAALNQQLSRGGWESWNRQSELKMIIGNNYEADRVIDFEREGFG